MGNDLPFLHRVVNLLEQHGITTWVFGGWAEELRGAPPRPHKDIDLLYPGDGFAEIDQLLVECPDFAEIRKKRFPHKRAFELDGVMVELFLVQADGEQLWTNFWGTTRFSWPANTLSTEAVDGFRVASAETLIAYRADHVRLAQ